MVVLFHAVIKRRRARAEQLPTAVARCATRPASSTSISPATIVTEISPLKEFYAAEAYHQNYFNLNKNRNPYCSVVIAPKLHKLIEKGIIKE